MLETFTYGIKKKKIEIVWLCIKRYVSLAFIIIENLMLRGWIMIESETKWLAILWKTIVHVIKFKPKFYLINKQILFYFTLHKYPPSYHSLIQFHPFVYNFAFFFSFPFILICFIKGMKKRKRKIQWLN